MSLPPERGIPRLRYAGVRPALTFLSTIPCLLALSTVAIAHAVAEGDKGYIQEITGVSILPFIYLGAKHRARAEQWYRHYGKWSLLASWVPVIGDPLTVVAGVLRESFPAFLLLVSLAKAGRYLVLVALHQAWFG